MSHKTAANNESESRTRRAFSFWQLKLYHLPRHEIKICVFPLFEFYENYFNSTISLFSLISYSCRVCEISFCYEWKIYCGNYYKDLKLKRRRRFVMEWSEKGILWIFIAQMPASARLKLIFSMRELLQIFPKWRKNAAPAKFFLFMSLHFNQHNTMQCAMMPREKETKLFF